MLMMPYNKLFTFNFLWAILCIFENQGPLFYICGPYKPQSYKKMGPRISLYVPSNLVSNYGNCNLPVCYIKGKAFLWTTMELTKLEDNLPVPSNMISPSTQL